MKSRNTGYRHRVDGNQTQISHELQMMRFRVDDVSRVKKLYDIVVTGRIYNTLKVRTLRVEVKMPGGELTPDEKAYHDADPFPETLIIAYCTDDILRWFGYDVG